MARLKRKMVLKKPKKRVVRRKRGKGYVGVDTVKQAVRRGASKVKRGASRASDRLEMGIERTAGLAQRGVQRGLGEASKAARSGRWIATPEQIRARDEANRRKRQRAKKKAWDKFIW